MVNTQFLVSRLVSQLPFPQSEPWIGRASSNTQADAVKRAPARSVEAMVSVEPPLGAILKQRLLAMLVSRNLSPMAVASAMAIAIVMAAQPSLAAMLSEWSYRPEAGTVGFVLDSTEKPRYFLQANPMRIVVDLPGSHVNPQVIESQAGGVFTQIRMTNTAEGRSRLVLQLAPGTVLKPGQVELTALGGGRWSLQPLLADGLQPAHASNISENPAGSELPRLDSTTEVEEPEFNLPSLEAMEAAAAEEEFVSMEETLARQHGTASVQAVAVPPGDIPGTEADISWGSSQLPPAPSHVVSGNGAQGHIGAAGLVVSVPELRPELRQAANSIGEASNNLPQLPQPRLGQAPLAFNPPVSSSLEDPANIVDTSQLRQSQKSLGVRPPVAVKPVIDPQLLPLDNRQQSAATLGGQTGLILNPQGRSNAASRRSARASTAPKVVVPSRLPQQQPQVTPVPTTAVPLPVASPAQPTSTEGEVPFLVEFGAPLPGVGL